jgi:hypothetical protein
MRKLGIFWFCHFLATVAGWYWLAALAQGAADSAVGPGTALIVLNAIMQILCFPVVMAALTFMNDLGSFTAGGFVSFTAAAAVNSAVVAAIVTALFAVRNRLRGGRPDNTPPGHDVR